MDIDENKAHFNLDDLMTDKPKKSKKKHNKVDEDIDDSKKVDDFKVNKTHLSNLLKKTI